MRRRQSLTSESMTQACSSNHRWLRVQGTTCKRIDTQCGWLLPEAMPLWGPMGTQDAVTSAAEPHPPTSTGSPQSRERQPSESALQSSSLKPQRALNWASLGHFCRTQLCFQ